MKKKASIKRKKRSNNFKQFFDKLSIKSALLLVLLSSGFALPQAMAEDGLGLSLLSSPRVTVRELRTDDLQVTQGAKEVTLLNLSVGSNKQAELREVVFKIVADEDGEFIRDIDNDIAVYDLVQSCELENKGTAISSKEPIDQQGMLEFVFNPGYSVTRTQALNLKCDLSNPSSQGEFAVAAMLMDANSVVVWDADGNLLPISYRSINGRREDSVNTDAERFLSILEHGSLSADLASTSPRSRSLSPASQMQHVGTWALASDLEDFQANTLTFVLEGDAEAVAYGTIEYVDEDGVVHTKSAASSAGQIFKFTGLEFFIGQERPSLIKFYVNTVEAGVGGLEFNAAFNIGLDLGTLNNSYFSAFGLNSGHPFDSGRESGIAADIINAATFRVVLP